MPSLIALVLLFSTSVTPGLEYPNPPKPRLHNPIDYIAWVNKTYGDSIKVNAADKYKAAFDAYVAPSMEALEQKWARGLCRSDEGGPNTAAAWVMANKRSLRLFREATEIRECYFPLTPTESGLLMEAFMPYLAHFRNMSRLLRTRARSQFDSGDVHGTVGDLLLILRSARHLDAHPSLLDHVTSLALARVVYSTMTEWLVVDDRPLDYDAVLRRFIHEEMSFDVPRRQILVDKANAWGTFQKMPLVEDEETAEPFKTQDDLDIAVAELDRWYKPYYGLYTEEYAKALKLWDEIQKLEEDRFTLKNMVARAKREHITPRVQTILSVVHLTASISTSYLWRDAVIHREVTAERNAMCALLAVNAYKAKHGRWPKSLAVAMPGDLAPYKTDPFSGKDLVYRVVKGEPVLYSVSLDGKDDGGKGAPKLWQETGDAVFSPNQGD